MRTRWKIISIIALIVIAVALDKSHQNSGDGNIFKKGIIDKIRYSTVALGYITTPQENLKGLNAEAAKNKFKIMGTGFLIKDDLVITNRHVIDRLREELKKNGITAKELYVNFISPYKGGVRDGFSPLEHVLLPKDTNLDIAFVTFKKRPEPEFSQSSPAKILDSLQVEVGTAVGVCGYAYSVETLHIPQFGINGFGAILQQGHVSALSPYNKMPSLKSLNNILLDVRATPGMSGGPVFTSDGSVIGILSSGRRDAAFVLALPLDKKRIDEYLKDSQKLESGDLA